MKLLKENKPALWLVAALAAAALALLLGGRGAGSSAASQQEARIAQVLSGMNGVGKVEVALFYAKEGGAPTGAVVVAQGAGNLGVRLNVIRALRTLLGLPENAVDVFEMEDGPS